MLRNQESTYLKETQIAYVMVNCMDGSEHAINEKIRETKYVREVLGTYGSYDVIAKIVSPSIEDLRDTITKIRKMAEIRSTTTLICLSIGFESMV